LEDIMTTQFDLTAENIKTLRNADDLVFRFHAEGHAEPGTWVEAIKRIDFDDGFGPVDRRISIELPGTLIENYTGHSWVGESVRREVKAASWVFPIRFHGPGFTLVKHILKPGDRMRPVFVVGNDSETLNKANLTRDELRVEIERGPYDQPGKCKTLSIMLDLVDRSGALVGPERVLLLIVGFPPQTFTQHQRIEVSDDAHHPPHDLQAAPQGRHGRHSFR
jgi:hypothetical protein